MTNEENCPKSCSKMIAGKESESTMKPIRSLMSAILLVGFIAVTGTAKAQGGVLSDQESTPDGDHSSLKVKVQAGRTTSLPPQTTKSGREDLTKSVGSSLVTRDER